MNNSGFWWILLACGAYGLVHSLLASNRAKALVERSLGKNVVQRYYRLFFVVLAGVTLLPPLLLAALLPDSTLYRIPAPWVALSLAIQALAGVGLLVGVSQTGAMSFLGIRQALEFDTQRSEPRPEKLVVSGLYRWVRHPLYTCSYLLLWLLPVMTWNLLALNLGLSIYLLVGTIFEERKLVEQFGQAYVDYRRRTPMLIPGLRLRR